MIATKYAVALAYACGVISGGAATWKLMSGIAAKTELRQVKAAGTAERAVRTKQYAVATKYETGRAQIDKQRTEVVNGAQQYMEARPDLRAVDLGDEWLCLVATADGQHCRSASSGADSAVPGTAAGAAAPRSDAAGLPADAGHVSDVLASASRARTSDESGTARNAATGKN